MARHLSERELMEVVDGDAAAAVRDHVETCNSCRSRVGHAREGMLLASGADVPEPSPLYWEAFRRQVGQRIDRDEPTRWLWRPMPALAALAVLAVLAGVTLRQAPGRSGSVAARPLPAWSPLPPAAEDPGLTVLQAVAADAEGMGPLAECRGIADCVAALSEDESGALADVLGQEIRGREL